MTLISSILMDVSTFVLPSSGHVILLELISPTDFDLTFKKRYSISNVVT